MAEAYFNRFAPEGWVAVSAGSRPARRVHRNAVRLMREEGVDIGGKKPRLLMKALQEEVDVAVVVCSGSECPLVYARHVEEWGVPDPAGTPMGQARKVRDEIKGRVLNLIRELR